jgi:hypothetical protein
LPSRVVTSISSLHPFLAAIDGTRRPMLLTGIFLLATVWLKVVFGQK